MPEALNEFEIVRVRCMIPLLPDYPRGFEAELHVPRAKIAEAKLPPFWRDGETMTVRPAE